MLLFAHIHNNEVNDGTYDETYRVKEIREGNAKAFEELFFEYHGQLIGFANTIIKSKEYARDIVQDVFLNIWRNREDWEIHFSLKVYLYQSVRNQALNLLEKQKTRQRLNENLQREIENSSFNESTYSHLSGHELKLLKRIWELAEEMPERRRLVFELNRKHGLSYKEISKVLNISGKTVENHLGQAIQFIRSKINIKDFE